MGGNCSSLGLAQLLFFSFWERQKIESKNIDIQKSIEQSKMERQYYSDYCTWRKFIESFYNNLGLVSLAKLHVTVFKGSGQCMNHDVGNW